MQKSATYTTPIRHYSLPADELARQIISAWFFSRRHLRILVRFWSEQSGFQKSYHTDEIHWRELIEAIHKPLQLRLTAETFTVLDGAFPIPLRFFSPEQTRVIKELALLKVFEQKTQLATRQYELSQFKYNSEVRAAVNPTSVLQEFVRLSFSGRDVSVQALINFYTKVFKSQRLRFIGAAIMLRHFDAMRCFMQVIHDSIGPAGVCELPRTIVTSLAKELPSLEQARAFSECLNGCFVLHIDAHNHQEFYREFNRIAEELQFQPYQHHFLLQSLACIIIDESTVAEEDEDKDILKENKENEEPKKSKTKRVWYEKRQHLAILIRILWGDWLHKRVTKASQLPQLFRHLLMTLPHTFAPILNRVGLLSESKSADLVALCMPYLDPQLYAISVPKTSEVVRDQNSWAAVTFFGTKYLLDWRPETQLLPLETWLSLMQIHLHDPKRAAMLRKLPDGLENMNKDLPAFANALRALYYQGADSCLFKHPLAKLDIFFGTLSAVLREHLPRFKYSEQSPQQNATTILPSTGQLTGFQILTPNQLRMALYNLHREHEYPEGLWNQSEHQVIYFNGRGVSLLDLIYTIEQRMFAVGNSEYPALPAWPERSWRCFYLDKQTVAAVVPKRTFYDAALKLYIIQRLSMRTDAFDDQLLPMNSDKKNDQVVHLPLYPRLVQMFFSTDPGHVYVSLIALGSFCGFIPNYNLPMLFSDKSYVEVLSPSEPLFSFYYMLPDILLGLSDPSLGDSRTRILTMFEESFLRSNCVFGVTRDGIERDYSEEYAQICKGVKTTKPCFISGLRALMTLSRPHYLKYIITRQIWEELLKLPSFVERSRLPLRESAEARATIVLKGILGIDGFYTTSSTSSEPPQMKLPEHMRLGDDDNYDDDEDVARERREEKKGPPKKTTGIDTPEAGEVQWPDTHRGQDCARRYPAHIVLYQLLVLPYIPRTVKKLIFNHMYIDKSEKYHDSRFYCGKTPSEKMRMGWTHFTTDELSEIQKPIDATGFAPGTFRPDTLKVENTDRWNIMTELFSITEFAQEQVATLTFDKFTDLPAVDGGDLIIEAKDAIFRVEKLDSVTYWVDPRRFYMPLLAYNQQLVWGNEHILVFTSPMSNQKTRTNTPRALYSPCDAFLNHLMTNYDDQFVPAPFPLDANLEDIAQCQRLSFPLETFSLTPSDSKSDEDKKKTKEAPPAASNGSGSGSSEAKALVMVGSKRSRSDSDLVASSGMEVALVHQPSKQSRAHDETGCASILSILSQAKQDVQRKHNKVRQFWFFPHE